ncbi:MAG TPA: DUF1501 domain-containing protein [Planctomycetaceae bacterium]|nr:DUF1501 domain-containing protein [Planctomycetaceae bacterium]
MISSLLKASTPLDRRTLLTAGGLSAVGLTLPQLFASRAAAKTATPAASRAPEATAQACILLYMLGGPPQQETFDMKPEAPGSAQSLFRPIATNVPGIEICELLPDLARQADRFAILRSVFHGGNALFHGAGVHYNLTGWPNFPREGEPLLDRRDYPGMGAVLNHLREPRQGLPVTVQLPMWITQDGPGREWAGQHAGFLGRKFDPLVMTYEGDNNLPGTLPPGFSLREDVGRERLGKRLDLQEVLGGPRIGDGTMLARDWAKYRAQALEVLDSGTAWKAFELDHESPQLRARYGDDRLGRSCLVARRLVEAGVTLVTVVFGGWDTHANHLQYTRDALLPPLNRAFAALLDDLADRGLLDTTLVAWTGEFGRTPAMNVSQPAGRDHWARVYSTVLAGGGIEGGQVHGRSDNLAAEPKDSPVHVSDFVATIYHALGYDGDTEVVDAFGRRHRIVAGRPVLSLF